MVINGYPWLSVVIWGYVWLSVVIHGYQWLSMVINGYPWLSVVICGYQIEWLSVVIKLNGYLWASCIHSEQNTLHELDICTCISDCFIGLLQPSANAFFFQHCGYRNSLNH